MKDIPEFCPHGITWNHCSIHKRDPAGERYSVTNSRIETVDGDRQLVLPATETTRRSPSGKIVYRDISDRMRIGHYRNPERNYLAGLQMEGSTWLRMSRPELSRIKAHVIWALRRKKALRGGSVIYLHGPAPDLVRLTADEKDTFEDLNRAMPNPNVNKLLTNPERKSPYTSERESLYLAVIRYLKS